MPCATVALALEGHKMPGIPREQARVLAQWASCRLPSLGTGHGSCLCASVPRGPGRRYGAVAGWMLRGLPDAADVHGRALAG
jgi:hypothetical protein